MKMDFQDHIKWKLPKGAKARLGKGYINEITYSPDSSRLAVASSIGIWIYDAETGEEFDLFMGHTACVERLSYSPDGCFIASSSTDKTVRLWDVATGEQKAILTHVGKDDISFAYGPDGNTIAIIDDCQVRLWDVGTAKCKATLLHDRNIRNFVYSPDGSTIATGNYTEIKLWDTNTGKHKTTLLDTGHHHKFSSLLYSPDGSTIATGGGNLSDRTVRLWDAETGEQKATLTHAGNNISFVYSPDGSTIATGGGNLSDRTVRLWDVGTGEQKTTLTQVHRVSGFAYSPDGNTITTTTTDRLPESGATIAEVCLWDSNTAKRKTILTQDVSRFVYGSDGSSIAWVNHLGESVYGWLNSIGKPVYGSDGSSIATVCHIIEAESYKDYAGVCLWSAVTGEHKATLIGDGNVARFVYSPNGSIIATGAEPLSNGTVRLWDAGTGKHKATLTGHTRGFSSLRYSPDGSTIATRTVFSVDFTYKISDPTYKIEVWLWDAGTGKHKAKLTHAEDIISFVYSPDGSTIATRSSEEVRLWESDTGKHKTTLTHVEGIRDFAYSPDGRIIATMGYIGEPVYGPDGGTIASVVDEIPFEETETRIYKGYIGVHLWDTVTGNLRATLTHSGHVRSIVYSPDGGTIATSGEHYWDGTVRLWDTVTGNLRATLTHSGHVRSIVYSPDGCLIVTGGEHSSDGTVQLWNTETGEFKTTLTEYVSPIKSLTYSPDGHTIVIGNDDGLQLWDVGTGEQKATLIRDRNVESFVYSPDGSTIAIESNNSLENIFGSVELWNAAAGKYKATLTRHTSAVECLAYSPDSRMLAIISKGEVQLWDVVSAEHLKTLTGPTDRIGGVRVGDMLLSLGSKTLSKAWIIGETDLMGVSFNPDGKTIASASKNGTVLLWEIPYFFYWYPGIKPQEIYGNWSAGWTLDVHTLSSRPLPDGRYHTERTEFGELVFQLKYRHDRSKIQPIAEVAAKFVKEKFEFAVDGHPFPAHPNLEAIIPIPPSDTNRTFQPVTKVAQEIGKLLSVPVRTDYLTKAKHTIPLKNLPNVENKREQLRGAFAVQSQNLKDCCVLLVDDLYDSGTTLTEATKVLYEQGGVRHVFVLTLTRTRTGSN